MWKPPYGPLVVATFICGFSGVADVNSADAQGLFRRLQNRAQSRLEPVTPPAPPSQPPGPAGVGGPTGVGGAAQQLSPIDPSAPSGPSGRGVSGGAASRPGSPFGGSILTQPLQNNPAATAGPGNAAARPSMGIQVVAATEGTPGLKVTGIRPGSRAGEAGLKQDDLIVAIDGTSTPTIEAVAEILQQRKVGDTLRATIVRGETAASVMIPLLDPTQIAKAAAAQSTTDSAVADSRETLLRPATQGSDDANAIDGAIRSAEFGAAVSGSPGKRGVVISSVVPGSSAAAAGLRVGDRIVSINGRLMRDEPTFQREFSRHAPGDELSINAVRDETLNTYDVVLSSGTASTRGGLAQSDAASSDSRAPDATGPDATGPGNVLGNPARGGSVLGGLGSVFGGLFGGSAENIRAESIRTGDNRTGDNRNGADSEDPAEDPLELGDGESIQRVGFEEEIKSDAQPLVSDPPSVEELTPPVAKPLSDSLTPSRSESTNPTGGSKDGDKKDQIIQSLRDEILRLQQRLNELEKD